MFFMAIHFPESNLRIMDYNRVLKSLNGLSTEDFLQRIAESYNIEPLHEGDGGDPHPQTKGQCSLYLDKRWFKLAVRDEKVDHSNLIKMLDC